ncbi:proline dehydrogenase family protein [Lacipirellula limnantheis]|uniref:L-glutamate gamma-semialdehyde dehydrogenase n=1 Tax=Lacipirellula limnantheis TaxID=2528024 RepID=A0A517TRB1_9BACT|nr:bifunctional proline dehydrogenase/L-glutamate gamma-semialdehyde dehydrogenase [Lacipirellula limnantheis]QDT70912.1 1-pyrroline-5-carboxylate dehydrogenase [Lacipirellula limnantheis]
MANSATGDLSQRLAELLAEVPAATPTSPASDVQRAILIARKLQGTAREMQTSAERRQQAELDRMIQSPADKATMVEITDQAFRARLSPRAADQLIHILDVQGVPRFFGAFDRTLLKGFQSFGAYLPGVAMPLVKEKMQQETANVVLPAEEDLLRQHLENRRHEGLRMNVNFLGESLLGEEDAQARLQSYLQALQEPFIEVMSVKISTIYSQISGLAREHTIEVLCDRMELLYRAAAKYKFRRHDGKLVPKFVYLDMEEYRDKEITAEVFMRTLDRPGFEKLQGGIALQAYIPDSFATQRRITEWARRRVEQGGAPVTIRVVKGANMEMERVEASLRGWPLATFSDKLHTDANYHRMLRFGMQPENLAAVRLGVASHNLFSLAYGLVLAAQSGRLDHVQFEMLEGMANHQRRALFELAESLLLYAPACKQEDFINAIGYLVRRLDENTGPDNFLRYAFNLEVGGATWNRLEQGFVASFAAMEELSDAPRRTQDRNKESGVREQESVKILARAGASPPPARPPDFTNAPDTDWSLPANSDWGAEIIARWLPRHGDHAAQVPLVIAGEENYDDREVRQSLDPSRPNTVVARYRQATTVDADRAVRCAADDPSGWRSLSQGERTATLHRVADEIARRRGDLMGAMLAEGGKILTESDPEISEAIDFCRFYAGTAEHFHELPGLAARGKGVVVVVSPWNFPLAIPCGGIAAGLAAGNTVILKPASDAVLIAHALCECFWAAGVPLTALQFVPCSGATVGQQLVSHDAVDAVILTGGTAAALDMLHRKPTINLLAETGGKNATIVTALSDRDLAIKNVLHSAFSHSGQKCSATSLLILEEEVYEDPKFRATLCDAVESLRVGSAWELHSKMGPLIRPPSGDLEQALKELEEDESWAVMPRLHVDGNASLVSPGVKWGVQPGSVTHLTEFFGPVLGVMCAKNLHAAIDLVNATGYGLTSGLESLDDREHRIWQEGIRAGNLYINRPTTGAIVLRQPFGGMGKSAFGPGIKAGGPNYVAPLMEFADATAAPGSARGSASTRERVNPNVAQPPGGAAGYMDSPEQLDITFPPASLVLPHESVAERRQQLHSLRNALADFERTPRLFAPTDVTRLKVAMESYLDWMLDEFEPTHDHFRLIGEDNLRRYLAVPSMRLRVAAEDTPWEIFARAAAARAAGCRVVVSEPPSLPESPRHAVELLDALTDSWAGAIEFIEETDEQLADALRAGSVGRLRYADRSRVPDAIRTAATESYVYVADAPVLAHGRVELLWYLQEQSLSHVYHRYGNLGRRADEPRAEMA